MLKKLLIDQSFSWSGSDEVRVKAYTPQKKNIGGAVIVVKEKNFLDTGNITLETSILALPKAATH